MNRLKLQSQEGFHQMWSKRALRVAYVTILTTSYSLIMHASESYAYKPRVAGGVPGRPTITSMASSNSQVTVTWTGFGGPYKVERCPAVGGLPGTWTQVGTTATEKTLTFPQEGDYGFLRVTGANPNYTGAATCLDCHENKHTDWAKTAHAGAFATLKAIKQEKNAECLPCHTVGAGLPTGFIDEATTPFFAGVQCENCHGPGGNHAAKPGDKTLRPLISLSANICGGCHTDSHHPTFDEWDTSLHAEVNEHTAEYFKSATGQARMLACGACHSGAVRMAMLTAKQNNTAVTLPSGEEAATTGITCAVCHDAHVKTANGAQLRNPTHSTQAFSYSTATNTTFAAQYDANVSICGQCHNARGATWKDTSRGPHHSQQYNMLTATIGYLVSTNAPRISAHATQVTGQCATCHVQSHSVASPTEENPNYTGHQFSPRLNSCQPCHIDEADAASKVEATQTDTKRRIQALKTLLDQWATTKSDPALRAKYGTYAWEYSTIGDVTDPSGALVAGGAKAPASAEQALIPDPIKQARFNLYIVAHDLSYGVHNAKYAQDLLKAGETLVQAKLAEP